MCIFLTQLGGGAKLGASNDNAYSFVDLCFKTNLLHFRSTRNAFAARGPPAKNNSHKKTQVQLKTLIFLPYFGVIIASSPKVAMTMIMNPSQPNQSCYLCNKSRINKTTLTKASSSINMPVSLAIIHVLIYVFKHIPTNLKVNKVSMSAKCFKSTAIPTEGSNSMDRNYWKGFVILFFSRQSRHNL